MFVSPSMLGTRGGGSIAAAYAAMLAHGESGYISKAQRLLQCRDAIRAGIDAMPELRVLGDPHMSIISWTTSAAFASRINIFAVADVMEKQFNFRVECQQHPNCLHITLTPPHCKLVDQFLSALRQSVEYVKQHPELAKEGSAATYGLIAKIPSDAIVDQFLVSFMDKVLQPSKPAAIAPAPEAAAAAAAEAEAEEAK